MTSIITKAPLWFVIFCLTAGFAYSFIMYRKDKQFSETAKYIIKIMFSLRFLSVSIISFLLLSPIFKTISTTIEKPILIFAQDNSESVADKDTAVYKKKIAEIIGEFEKKYEVKKFTFGEEVRNEKTYDFTDKETDISELIADAESKYYNRNVGALILASDGLYNKGNNPIYASENINFPIYTIAQGDTTVKKDIILSDIKHNKIAFLNNKYPIQAVVFSNKMKGKTSNITLYLNNKKLFTEKIIIDKDIFSKKIDFEIPANETGVQQIKLVIDKTEGELTSKNNSKTVIVEVIAGKQKILILANAPHPDISAIRQALKTNRNFETEFYTVKKFNKNIKEYNLVILHDVPSRRNSATSILAELIKSNIPVLHIIGKQSYTSNFNKLKSGLKIIHKNHAFDNTQGEFNKNFSLFELDNNIKDFVEQAPPLLSPFGNYSVSGNNSILFYRQIKRISTKNPLFMFHSGIDGKKTAVITGEGIWRWRIYDFKEHENHYLFNELINKTIQYLTLQINKERFKVNSEKIIPENREIIFDAQVYNKSYELINKDDVSLQITDSTGKVYDYIFDKIGKSYSLNAGIFPSGTYKWKSETLIDDKKTSKTGEFTVLEINIELANTVANHKLLYQLSSNSGGKMYYPKDMKNLITEINNNKNVVPVSYSETKTENILNMKIIFFVILTLLSAEWFLRKYNGGY